MDKRMIVGYASSPETLGAAIPIYEINNRFYMKSSLPAKRVNREFIDVLKYYGNYISEPRELYFERGMHAFNLDDHHVVTGKTLDEFLRNIMTVFPNSPADVQDRISTYLDFILEWPEECKKN